MSQIEKDLYFLNTFGLQQEDLEPPTTSIYFSNGIVVQVKQNGYIPNPSYGGWCISYSLSEGAVLFKKYIDHQCANNVFSELCDPESLPEEVSNILGKSLEAIQNLHPDWTYTEIST
jgi:hypothetical protein